MSRRADLSEARRIRPRAYAGRGYRRRRLVKAILAGFDATGPHPYACGAFRVVVQPSCEDDPQAVAEWIAGIDGVEVIQVREREIIVRRVDR